MENIINQNMLKFSKNARVKAFPQGNFLRAIAIQILPLSPVVFFFLSHSRLFEINFLKIALSKLREKQSKAKMSVLLNW